MFVRGWNETTDLDYSDEATRTVTSSRTLIKARPHMWDGRNSFLQLVVAILGSGIYCCICLINRTLTCLSASLFFQYFSDSSPAENLGRGAEIEQSTTIQILWGPSCCAKLTSPHQTYSPFLGFNLAPNTKQLQVLRMRDFSATALLDKEGFYGEVPPEMRFGKGRTPVAALEVNVNTFL